MIASKSEVTDFIYSDLYDDSDDEDETNRLIQLRNADYMDIVEDDFKLVVVSAGYPKSKMRLQQMALFQKCLNDIIDMQLKAGLLKRVPCFIDYYLHRGALVCICKDMDTRDWIVRISPGLQDRMFTNLMLLKAKVKRLCLAVMKIPRSSWPTTAQDAFKLLQYFNPTLKTQQWKIYSQKVVDDVEITSFLVDRVSGETIRGPTFKNVVDYDQIDFELTGYTKIYYECLLSSMEEDLHSIRSRVKLLAELKSGEPTPRTLSEVTVNKVETVEQVVNRIKNADDFSSKLEKVKEKFEGIAEITEETSQENIESVQNKEAAMVCKQNVEVLNIETKNELRNSQNNILSKLKDIEYIGPKDDILIWSDESPNAGARDIEQREEIKNDEDGLGEADTTMAFDSINTESERSDSVTDSVDTLLFRNSNLNIDSNRGIAYHRRTNYLHVENELKVAITLEGYPKNKLEGIHIRRLKHLFKEYMHKDMKNQSFSNLIMPTFLDVYLSNGAIIYICDSLETKDYLIGVLPNFIHTTGLKLIITDVKDLVRYTRIVMRLPKEKAHLESTDILLNLQYKYPKLNPECWKCYCIGHTLRNWIT
ncbi:hypothetical protein K1T71_015226 [Dendrolimus kikuchii]|nr:hypothetical protein K1T71_015226 [Dendrolimus kikuchii]